MRSNLDLPHTQLYVSGFGFKFREIFDGYLCQEGHVVLLQFVLQFCCLVKERCGHTNDRNNPDAHPNFGLVPDPLLWIAKTFIPL